MTINQFLIEEDTTVLETLKCLNENGEKIAYVCNEQGKLMASVSDGDIRGYLVREGEISASISNVANYNPIYLLSEKRDSAEAVMKVNGITSVPIVNHAKKILDIIFLDSCKNIRCADLKLPLVIMAGGQGRRLKPYTTILPKPLMPIGNMSITEYIMGRFKQYGCDEYYMIVNYKKEIIKAYYECNEEWSVHFIDENDYLGTAGGLKLLPIMCTPFFLTNCDVIFETKYDDIYLYHKNRNCFITIVCVNSKVTIPYGVLEVTNDGYIKEIREKPSYTFNMNAGLYLMNSEIQQMIGDNEKIDMPDLLRRCLDNGKKIGTYFIDESEWMDIGKIDEYEKTKKKLRMV